MELNNLKPGKGAKHAAKRVGRDPAHLQALHPPPDSLCPRGSLCAAVPFRS